ncbi:nSTAND1 domain-containing NTPase [Paractinoplanes globisporus]|uniref:PD40 domain-containing protein n=1 Tax=Paractinoplanes globisporus TaxID=113565 RepID=A0ABW6W8D5_9ACTN|nr:PD40 domain-containing protein [Actinoplanes globisporus]
MSATPSPAERARSGIRSWVRATGTGMRRATPYAILAFLSASAVAPIAGAALGAPADYAAALNQLGGMGSNFLADALATTAARLETGDRDWRDEIAGELLARLETGDTGLRDELTALLHAIGAVETALLAADEQSRQQIATAFESLQVLAADTRRVLDEIRLGLNRQVEEQRRDTTRVLGALAATTSLIRSLQPAPAPAAEPGPPTRGIPPYPGLASFDIGDAPFFHGRERLVRTLLGRLDEHLLGGPPLVVVGASGAGKSSLLRAGLLPLVAADGLGDGSGAWPWVLITPGATPLATLRAALVHGGRQVILVDQFEELFTQCPDPAERASFVDALAAVPDALLIVAVRADFYPQCTELPGMAALLGTGQVVVGPLDEDELRRAIAAPAGDAGLTVEPGLVEVLLRDYEPGALPLLAHALRATWERREGDTLTVTGYRATGGIRRAVAASAERVYATLDEPGRQALRAELLSLVTVVDGLAVRRRAAFADVNMAVLRPLIAERLVTAGEDTVQISHEALLDGWPRLAGWLADAREEILLRQRLAQAAREWQAAGEDPDALYRGARLAAVREYATDLPETPRRFLAASAAAAEQRERTERRTTRRLRRLVAGLGVALLLAVGGGLVAVERGREARANGLLAASRQHAAEARTEHWSDPLSSVDKALRSWAESPTIEARSALLYAQQTQLLGRLGTRTGAETVAMSADGRRVAVGYLDGEIQLWDAATLRPTGPALRHETGNKLLHWLAFSPDGRSLASGSLDPEGVAVWDVATGRMRFRLKAYGGVGWLPDSSALLAARFDSSTPVLGEWSAADGRRLTELPVPDPAGSDVVVSADGKYLASCGPLGGSVLRLPGGAVQTRLPGRCTAGFDAADTVYSTGIDDDSPVQARPAGTGWKPVNLTDPAGSLPRPAPGRKNLAVTPDGTVLIASWTTGETLRLTVGGARVGLGMMNGAANDLALSADGRTLVTAGAQDPPTLMRINGSALPHSQAIGHLAVDPAGGWLATGSKDPAIRVWDPRTGALHATIPVDADDGPLGLAYGPDGSLAAAFAQGGRVLVYDRQQRPRATLRLPAGLYPGNLAFSPDGTRLAVVTNPLRSVTGPRKDVLDEDDPDVVVWDTRTYRQIAELKLPGALAMQPAFTPDGKSLLVTSNGRTNALTAKQDGAIWRFRAADLTLADSRELPGVPLDEITVSPDSTTFAIAADNTARLFKVDGLRPLRDVGGQPSPVTRVVWSPDGSLLATATDTTDGLILLSDPATGAEVAEVRGNSNNWGQIRFTTDGKTLIAGLNDWTVGIWRLDPAEAVRSLCALVVPADRAGGTSPPALCE